MRPYLRFLCITLLILTTASVGSAQTPPFNRTVIVPSTGNAAADGAALITALAGLSPTPSSINRWLIKLEPGIYDVGTTPVVMRQYVDLEGSGIVETTIRGSVEPPPGFLLGGLVEGASNSEIRSLTIICASSASVPSCQGMSLDTASPRVTRVRMFVQGSGTGSHSGIRTSNSSPILKEVQILVKATNSFNNFGIVYGDSSTLDISRSSITARNASNNNWAIVIKENLGSSPMRDSSLTAIGGSRAGGIMYLSSLTSQNLQLDNVHVSARGATTSQGIGAEDCSGTPKIWVRGGRIFGDTEGVNILCATVHISNSEVSGTDIAVLANNVWIGSTWVRGGGSILGGTSATCAGVFDDAFAFFPNTCP